jgi:hypothetical protein
MKNTPSALKWLAEKRGRLAHDLGQTRQIAADVNARVAALEVDLAAVDRAITIFDTNIDPERIEAVNAHGRYGKRGALKDCILGMLRAHGAEGAEWVATQNIEMLVCLELGLTFETPAVRKRWYDNSFAKQLRLFVEQGLVERLHDPRDSSVEMGRWRWLRPERAPATLAELKAGRLT